MGICINWVITSSAKTFASKALTLHDTDRHLVDDGIDGNDGNIETQNERSIFNPIVVEAICCTVCMKVRPKSIRIVVFSCLAISQRLVNT